jgi:hypothetical protein
LVSSLLSFCSLLADFFLNVLVYGGEIREAGLLAEDGGGEEAAAVEVVVVVMAIIRGLRLHIAAHVLMTVPVSDLEVDLLRRAGDQVSGREQWVALQRDMKWAGGLGTVTELLLDKKDHSSVDKLTTTLERAARRHVRRHRSQARQPALDLGRQGVGSRSAILEHIY